MTFFWDFPIPPEGHPNADIRRSYIWGGYKIHRPITSTNDSQKAVSH